MSYAITIIADDADLELLRQAADGVPDVTLTEPEALQTTGDGLNFPIDLNDAVEGLKIAAAFVGTVNGIRQLVAAWSQRRAKAKERRKITVLDGNTGETLFAGEELTPEASEEIAGGAKDAEDTPS